VLALLSGVFVGHHFWRFDAQTRIRNCTLNRVN